MKLYKLLFESVSHNQIISALTDMMNNSSSDTKQELKNIAIQNKYPSYQKLAENFYQANKDSFDKITKHAETFEHLGGGTKGNAFNLGNQILKIEIDTPWNSSFSSKERATKASEDLFKKPLKMSFNDKSIANYVPMIYDQGTFKFHNEEINWIIMEKLEIPQNDPEMDLFLDAITRKFNNGYNLQDLLSQDPLDDDEKELIKDIGEDLRLRSDWYENLITGMWKLYDKGITDFHAGNIGIRRSGGEGTLVFFD